jgi:hypothetical protein
METAIVAHLVGSEEGEWRIASGLSGGQCSCAAKKFRCLTTSPRTQHPTLIFRFALPKLSIAKQIRHMM